MPKRSRKPTDLNRLAASIVGDATDEDQDPHEGKNPAAVELGRLGGMKGGKARAAKLTPQERSEIAGKAAAARWGTDWVHRGLLVRNPDHIRGGSPPLIRDIEDFRALDPFFRIIEQGLQGLVDADHLFNLLAENVVFDFVITVPDYPRHVVGRDNLIELYRGYGSTFHLDRCYDLRVHRSDSTSSVVLEYASQGKVVATGYPYSNRYVSVITLKDREVSRWRDYLDPLRVFAALEGR
jgi:ketosteroid isomerase-like protein